MSDFIDIALAESGDEEILITAPFSKLSVGALVEIGNGELFEVTHLLHVREGDEQYDFITAAHGCEAFPAQRVFLLDWDSEVEQDACNT